MLPNDKSRCEGEIKPLDGIGIIHVCEYRNECERYLQRHYASPTTSIVMMMCDDKENMIKTDLGDRDAKDV